MTEEATTTEEKAMTSTKTGIFSKAIGILSDWRNLLIICLTLLGLCALITFSGNTVGSFFDRPETQKFFKDIEDIRVDMTKLSSEIVGLKEEVKSLRQELNSIKNTIGD